MKVVLIAPNVSLHMGGEAIKAYQYFDYLLRQGYDVTLCTHARCRDAISADFPADRMIFVEDDRLSVFLWKSRLLRQLLNLHFQLQVRRRLVRDGFAGAVWHFITPISPVEPKIYPKGTPVVIGPLNGNIYYPPAFMSRMSRHRRLAGQFHRLAQRFCRVVFADKRRASVILNSGYGRTRESLGWAGVDPGRIHDVLDSALPDYVNNADPILHEGTNRNFVSMGRIVDVKGLDLAVRALAKCPDDYTLTFYGGGEDEDMLRQLAAALGVADRVAFAGWLEHEKIAEVMADFRGFVFPSLAEANGIVVQEMMMLGLPVIALNWGGPADLISAETGMLVDPISESYATDGLAAAMKALAEDPDLANDLAQRARATADGQYSWDVVGQTWAAAYGKL